MNGLRKYAEEMGAVKNGRVKWRALAEGLAKKHEPDLLEGEIGPRVGAPKKVGFDRDEVFLANEIDYVKTKNQLSSDLEACKQISKNKYLARYYTTSVTERGADGRVAVRRVKARYRNPWKGIKPGTLKRRYHTWLSDEKKRQEEMKVEIRDCRTFTDQDREVARDLERRVRDLEQLIKK